MNEILYIGIGIVIGMVIIIYFDRHIWFKKSKEKYEEKWKNN